MGCAVCGLDGGWVESGEPCPNQWCRRADREWSVVFPVARHDGRLRQAIARYKYREELWWADVFAAMVARYLEEHPTWFEEFSAVTSVPCYVGPGSDRDWDPVGLVLERLAVRIGPGWSVLPGIVEKRAETPRMQGRSWAQRQVIAAGPLRRCLGVRNAAAVAGSRLLLLDDVMAEGSTLREVARCLRGAGAAEVAGLVLARPKWIQTPMV